MNIRHKYHVHKDNMETFSLLEDLRDENGRFPFIPNLWHMMTIIGGFPRDKGCYMSLKNMAGEMGRISERTLKDYGTYLEAQDLVAKFKRKEGMKTICIRWLKKPKKKTIESMASFRKRTGKYKYQTSEAQQNRPFFKNKGREIFSTRDGKFSPKRREIFAPYIEKVTKRTTTRELPPKSPTSENEAKRTVAGVRLRRPSVASGVGQGRPHYSALRPSTLGGLVSQEKEKPVEYIPEEIPVAKKDPDPEPPIDRKKKKPRNQRERRAEAIKKHNKGHIVNPMGQPDNQLRRMRWQQARDIGPTGGVTAAQLWRHLNKKYLEAHGVTIEDQMPTDRYAITAWFDKLRKKFLVTCGCKVDYRDLSAYFDWILDPQRLKKIIGISTATGKAAALKAQQLEGQVYIRQFYDQVLRRRKQAPDKAAITNPGVKLAQEKLDEFQDICEEIHNYADDPVGLVICMARFGIPLVAQYFYERQATSESQCRKRIIHAMTQFVMQAEDREEAIRYLDQASSASERKAYLYNENTLWQDWAPKCKEIIGAANEEIKNAQKDA